MINWQEVETVLLDMDGTLLDLHFDNYFWLNYVPKVLSLKRGQSLEQVSREVFALYKEAEGSLKWYCIEHWQKVLGLELMELKQEQSHKITWMKDARFFLRALKQAGKRRILLTNAHPLSLKLKSKHTGIDREVDECYSTHFFGHAKESPVLWRLLEKRCAFDPKTSLFIDDSEKLLKVAKQAGIAYQLGIFQPDSQRKGASMQEFQTIRSYRSLIQSLHRAST